MRRRRTNAPYLRALRRRLTLNQSDVAFLLGTSDGTRVSRHETGQCVPPLEVVLAYAVMFDVVAEEIYHHESAQVAEALCERARLLYARLAHSPRALWRDARLAALSEIITRCIDRARR